METQPINLKQAVMFPEVPAAMPEIPAPKTVTLNGKEYTAVPFFFYRHRELLVQSN